VQATKETIRRSLIVATTMTKGVSLSMVTGDMVEGWFKKAQAHEMTDEGFLRAFDLATDRSTFFPSWHEVLSEYRKAEKDTAHLILDPVKTGEHMGVIEIGSRSRCELLGLPFVELRPDELEALPSPESREEAKERLESALAKVETKRIKPEKQRAEFFEGEDTEALEKARRMVSAVRG